MTFHSSGTPIGTFEVMKPWSTSISTSPTVSDAPPAVRPSTSGTASSSAVPRCPIVVASRDGRRSSGYARYMRVRSQRQRVTGEFDTITPTTDGKWWFSFDTPAQPHSASCTAWAPASGSVAATSTTIVVQ